MMSNGNDDYISLAGFFAQKQQHAQSKQLYLQRAAIPRAGHPSAAVFNWVAGKSDTVKHLTIPSREKSLWSGEMDAISDTGRGL